MIRSLVPSVALIAVAAVAHGADSDWLKPEFRFGGFVDVNANLGNDHSDNSATDSIDRDRWYANFLMFGGVHTDVRFSDEIGGRVDVWLIPGGGEFADPMLRDGFVSIHEGDWTAKVGMMIRPLGWTSPQPDQWYRVNESTIGYTGNEPYSFNPTVFGQDVIGGSLTWARRDVPLRVTGMLNNGFFSGPDNGDYRPSAGRQRNGLGYGADVAFIPNDKVTVDFQAAVDARSNRSAYQFGMQDGNGLAPNGRGAFDATSGAAGADSGGNPLLLDLNTTLKPVRALTLGAELARFHIGDARNNGNIIDGTNYNRWQAMVMANWAFEQARFPLSVTAEIQHIQARQDAPGSNTNGRAWEYTAALLTQPFTRVPLHLDAEFSYADVHSDQNLASNGWQLAGRALLDF